MVMAPIWAAPDIAKTILKGHLKGASHCRHFEAVERLAWAMQASPRSAPHTPRSSRTSVLDYALPALLDETENRPEVPPPIDDCSPGTVWNQTFGEVLSPSVRKRNARLHERTPSKSHLGEDSVAWLQRHQEAARMKLERRCARSIARGTSPTKAPSAVPLIRLETGSWGAARQPPLVRNGRPPQLLLLEMEGLLVERFRRSMWSGAPTVHGRPGVVSGLQQLRRSFLLVAICRSPADVSERVLAELTARGAPPPPPPRSFQRARAHAPPLLTPSPPSGAAGLRFDLAYALPPSSSRRKSSPCLSLAAQVRAYGWG